MNIAVLTLRILHFYRILRLCGPNNSYNNDLLYTTSPVYLLAHTVFSAR